MSNTTSDKLQGIINSKELIRKAIVDKGVPCDKSVTLAKYAEKIRAIGQGGGSGIGMAIKGSVMSVTQGTYEPANLQILQQPHNLSGVVNTDANFIVVAVGYGLSYQWQQKSTSSTSWSDATSWGNTTSILCVPITTARNGYTFRCMITDKAGNSVTSNEVTLTSKEA